MDKWILDYNQESVYILNIFFSQTEESDDFPPRFVIMVL